MANDDRKQLRCSFCGKPQDKVERLIAGPGVCICNECVELCQSVLDEEEPDVPQRTHERTQPQEEIYVPRPAEIQA